MIDTFLGLDESNQVCVKLATNEKSLIPSCATKQGSAPISHMGIYQEPKIIVIAKGLQNVTLTDIPDDLALAGFAPMHVSYRILPGDVDVHHIFFVFFRGRPQPKVHEALKKVVDSTAGSVSIERHSNSGTLWFSAERVHNSIQPRGSLRIIERTDEEGRFAGYKLGICHVLSP